MRKNNSPPTNKQKNKPSTHLLIIPAHEITERPYIDYEFPPHGTTKLGYMVRRMHKTEQLLTVPSLIAQRHFAQAVEQVGLYMTTAMVSFGRLPYEPSREAIGSSFSADDPATGATVTATYESDLPQVTYSFQIVMPNGGTVTGYESRQNAELSTRGWGTPIALNMTYTLAQSSYEMAIQGEVTREIVPRLAGPWHMRAFGQLTVQDKQGNTAVILLRRDASASLTLCDATQRTPQHKEIPLI